MILQAIGETPKEQTPSAGDSPQAAPTPDPAHSIDARSSKALLESAPVAIYHTDAAGNMTYSNPEYRRIFGLKIGHSPDAWAERLHPGDRARMEEAWADFCLHPVPSRFGYRTQSIDGDVRHFSEQVVAVEGVPGWVGHHQRFHRPGHRARQFAQDRNHVPQHLRSGADRHCLRRPQRQDHALQSGPS